GNEHVDRIARPVRRIGLRRGWLGEHEADFLAARRGRVGAPNSKLAKQLRLGAASRSGRRWGWLGGGRRGWLAFRPGRGDWLRVWALASPAQRPAVKSRAQTAGRAPELAKRPPMPPPRAAKAQAPKIGVVAQSPVAASVVAASGPRAASPKS